MSTIPSFDTVELGSGQPPTDSAQRWEEVVSRVEAYSQGWQTPEHILVPPLYTDEHLAGVADVIQHRSSDDVRHRVGAEGERRHDAEVAAAAAHRPVQVLVFVGTRVTELTVRVHDVDRLDVVERGMKKLAGDAHDLLELFGRRFSETEPDESALALRTSNQLTEGGVVLDAEATLIEGVINDHGG